MSPLFRFIYFRFQRWRSMARVVQLKLLFPNLAINSSITFEAGWLLPERTSSYTQKQLPASRDTWESIPAKLLRSSNHAS